MKRIIREVSSTDDPQEQYDHFKANESTRHAKKKSFLSMTDGFQREKETNCIEIVKAPSDGPKKIINMWIRSWQLLSHTQLHNYTFGVDGQGPKPGPVKNRADFPQAIHQLIALVKQVEKPNPPTPGRW